MTRQEPTRVYDEFHAFEEVERQYHAGEISKEQHDAWVALYRESMGWYDVHTTTLGVGGFSVKQIRAQRAAHNSRVAKAFRRRRKNGRGTGEGLSVIATPGCWCGGSFGHDWPGKEDGAPHPRQETTAKD